VSEKAAKAPRKQVDLEALEMDYRAGVMSVEEVGQKHGISKGRVSQLAKQHGWVRNLNAKIAAKAEAKVQAEAAREKAKQEALNDPTKQAARRLVESEVVEANAELQYQVRMGARRDVSRNENLVRKLLDELELVTDNRELFEQLGEILDESGPTENGGWKNDKQNEIYRKVISLTGRVDSAKKLVEMLEKLVALKFRVFGVKDEDGGPSTVDDLLLKAAQLTQQ
jgi:hypothetical protein